MGGFEIQGQHVRPQAAGDLFRQGVKPWRQSAVIQGPFEHGDPVVVEIVENARSHSGPVVNPHGQNSHLGQ